MNKFFILFLSFLFLFSFSILADDNIYNQIGGDTWDFSRGSYDFDSNTQATYIGTPLVNPKHIPVIEDIDNDGVKEIYVVDEDVFRVYQYESNSLVIKDTFQLNSDITSIPYIYDIDGDSNKEIIIGVGDSTGGVHIFDYSNNTLTNTSIAANLGNRNGLRIACVGSNQCVFGHHDTNTHRNLQLQKLNSTDITSYLTVTKPLTNDGVCYPNMGGIITSDYDEDGKTEIVISYLDDSSGGGNQAFVISSHYFNDTNDLNADTLSFKRTSGIAELPNFLCTSSNEALNYITSPLIFDFDKKQPGNELLIGVNIDSANFRIYSYKNLKSGGTETDLRNDQYPLVSNGEGELVSNLIVANTFTDTGKVDVCVMGYQRTESRMDLVCASEQTSSIPETDVFNFFNINLTNLDTNNYDLNHMVHSVDSVTPITGDTSEFITAIGNFQLDFVGNNELELIWVNAKAYATSIPVDFNEDGRGDIVALSDSNLWLIFDGFVNTNCDSYNCIREGSTTNPSIEDVIQINTTFHVNLIIEDYDFENGLADDKVAGRVIAYYGDTNEQDTGWSQNWTSGTNIPFESIKINKTGSYTIRFMARDTNDPSKVEIIDAPFNIGEVGSEFGDSIFSFGGSTTTDEDTIDAAGVNSNNPAYAIVKSLSDESGFTQSGIWIFFMLLVPIMGVVMIFQSNDHSSQHLMGVVMLIGIIEFFMVLYGTYTGYLSIGWVTTIAVFALAGLGFYIRSHIMGHNRGV